MNCGQFPKPCCRPHPGKGLARLSGRTIICRTTHHIMYPTRNYPESRTEVSLGVRGQHPAPQRAHAPPTLEQHRPTTINALDTPRPAQVSKQGADQSLPDHAAAYAARVRPVRAGPSDRSAAVRSRFTPQSRGPSDRFVARGPAAATERQRMRCAAGLAWRRARCTLEVGC
jgi:hypothetical protein